MGHLREEGAFCLSGGDSRVRRFLQFPVCLFLPTDQVREQLVDQHHTENERQHTHDAIDNRPAVDIPDAGDCVYREARNIVPDSDQRPEFAVVIPKYGGCFPIRPYLSVRQGGNVRHAVPSHLIDTIWMVDDLTLRIYQEGVSCLRIAAAQDVHQFIHEEIDTEYSKEIPALRIIDYL